MTTSSLKPKTSVRSVSSMAPAPSGASAGAVSAKGFSLSFVNACRTTSNVSPADRGTSSVRRSGYPAACSGASIAALYVTGL